MSDLSRAVSHALRHEPWVFELELDADGWTSLDSLVEALRREPAWFALDVKGVVEMVAGASKKRHEIEGDRIRALYGHSVPGRISKTPAAPPNLLFHGTSPRSSRTILIDGLWPIERQYVHLSVDRETAREVGRRKSPDPVVLAIDAQRAHHEGARFYRGNDRVWLADSVRSYFIAELPPA